MRSCNVLIQVETDINVVHGVSNRKPLAISLDLSLLPFFFIKKGNNRDIHKISKPTIWPDTHTNETMKIARFCDFVILALLVSFQAVAAQE